MTTYSTGVLDWGVRTLVTESDGHHNEIIILAESLGEALNHLRRLPHHPGVDRELVCRSTQLAPGRGWQAVTA